mmetsp:Transcript_18969/g.44041  ORF Transcript_18969/g.44041 Transcript_18969/m.44041 type:complete len:310 (+) Transcript_18969:374-1303(+)
MIVASIVLRHSKGHLLSVGCVRITEKDDKWPVEQVQSVRHDTDKCQRFAAPEFASQCPARKRTLPRENTHTSDSYSENNGEKSSAIEVEIKHIVYVNLDHGKGKDADDTDVAAQFADEFLLHCQGLVLDDTTCLVSVRGFQPGIDRRKQPCGGINGSSDSNITHPTQCRKVGRGRSHSLNGDERGHDGSNHDASIEGENALEVTFFLERLIVFSDGEICNRVHEKRPDDVVLFLDTQCPQVTGDGWRGKLVEVIINLIEDEVDVRQENSGIEEVDSFTLESHTVIVVFLAVWKQLGQGEDVDQEKEGRK